MNRYQKLFDDYVDEMRESMGTAKKWWKKLQHAETKRLGSSKEADAELRERWPFGPASHPVVLATYRKYFLSCEELNREIEALEDAEEDEEEDEDEDEEETEDSWGEEDEEEEEDEDDFGAEENPIPAWNLLIDRLVGRDDDLSDFLSGMVYAPIGLVDEDIYV